MILGFSIFWLACANAAVALAALVQASTGLGFAMIAVPLLALISFDLAPGPSLFVSLFLTLAMLGDGWSKIVRAEIGWLLPTVAVGTALGALLLNAAPRGALGVVFAVVILIAVLLSVLAPAMRLGRGTLAVGGVAAGLMGTISGIHGAPLAVIYQQEQMEKTRPTMALIFLCGSTMSLIGLASANAFGAREAMLGAMLLPGLAIGFLVAVRLRGRLSRSMGRRLMLSIAATSAIVLLVNST